mmetsp:Transcript_3570/g.3928  ORF Transcript_3570/g.3928 Transcript_3570/m.3928 type:complete len:181 (-) Transcript_3570:86-628(-)|eukprot:CAMPEP_0194358272 /NCGR_PEP_ID=MMETSP0174-20130528/5535_1 /TAXON_ID=216777 /ORGANISM="Proboscia alata, Strain PI-D3" /LENGTH=180 /DNA_ID=CAMNT_0039128535 /DNA_START=59 /DNA_END=601 /DNA_ORIENTATION=+
MVLFILSIKAELDGVSSISLSPGSNLCMSVRNPLSDYEKRDKIVIDTSQHVEQEENSKEPPCHFTIKWEGMKKRSTITILDESSAKAALKKKTKKGKVSPYQPRIVTAEDSESFVPVLVMECRGVEPYAFHPMDGEFTVASEGNIIFDDVDLSEGDWGDYDEENDAAVSITDFESEFVNP